MAMQIFAIDVIITRHSHSDDRHRIAHEERTGNLRKAVSLAFDSHNRKLITLSMSTIQEALKRNCNCPLYIFPPSLDAVAFVLGSVCVFRCDLQINQQTGRKNVNWNQKWAKSSGISCGMFRGFTPVVHQKYQQIGRDRKKMSEQAFCDGKRTLHRIFSHTFYWWTVARRKKIPAK